MHKSSLLEYYWRRFIGKEYSFVSSLEEIQRSIPEDVEFLEVSNIKRAYSEYSPSETSPATLKYANERKSYKAIFRNVACFANSDVLLFKNKKAFCEIKTFKEFRNVANCEDGYVLIEDRPWWHRNVIPQTIENIEKGIFLTGIFSWNYYHFVYAVLARILKTYDIPTDVPLLVDESCGYIESYKELLDFCNKQHRKIIYLKNQVRYNVKELYYISSPLVIVPNFMPGVVDSADFTLYDIDNLKALRKELLPLKDQTRNYPKRIFISRRNASSRRKYNENECIMFLKQYGFEIVYPEQMSISEQIATFSAAETIVTGSGAALTNLLYCSANANVIILFGYHHALSFWQTLACVCGLRMYQINDPDKGILTKKNKPYDIHNDFRIELSDLKKVIEKIGYQQTISLPTVTVSVLTYNSEKYVKETLESIKKQSYPNIILQICDDCSTDNTLSICKGWIDMYGDRFVKTKIITSETNTGVSANCNRGWDNCETDYYKEIAGDDILLPNCISDNMLYASEHPDALLIFSKMEVLPCEKNADRNAKIRHENYEKSIDYSFFKLRDDERVELLKSENHLLAPVVFTKVSGVRALGLRHDERIPDIEDYPKWINAAILGIKFHFFEIPTVAYRFHDESMSNSPSSSWRYQRNLGLIRKYYTSKFLTDDLKATVCADEVRKSTSQKYKTTLQLLTKKNYKHLQLVRILGFISAILLLLLIVSLISIFL